MIIKITETNSGQRLDKFLAKADYKNLSRSQIQKLIKAQIITINGLPASPHYALKTGDIINIKKIIKPKLGESHTNEKNNVPKPLIKIMAETDDFIVINKPAGLAAQARAGYTLAEWLKAEYPDLAKVGDDPERPGLVHRLDKDVSGLMVIAKNQKMFEHLKQQFQNRTIIKEYTALVYGKIQADAGSINFPIKRAQDGYKMAAMPATVRGEPAEAGRSAQTEFTVETRFINYTLLKIKIRTGRTHQIRVHLTAYDHPLVGDNIYATAKTRRQNKKLCLNRIFLIADRLSFMDLQNNPIDFKISLTQELKNILKEIKL